MKINDCRGKLIVVDMYSCNEAVINNVELVKEELTKACEQYNMALAQIIVCEDAEVNEYSLAAVCKNGHVTLHVYKSLGFVAADVLSCHEGAQPSELGRFLRIFLGADKSKITLLERGDFGTEVDMKPRRNSKVKFTRHTRSLGNKLKKMILKPRSI